MFAAPAVMVAPFLLGFGTAATVLTVAIGALLIGLGFAGRGSESSVPALGPRGLRLHARGDGGDRRHSPSV